MKKRAEKVMRELSYCVVIGGLLLLVIMLFRFMVAAFEGDWVLGAIVTWIVAALMVNGALVLSVLLGREEDDDHHAVSQQGPKD